MTTTTKTLNKMKKAELVTYAADLLEKLGGVEIDLAVAKERIELLEALSDQKTKKIKRLESENSDLAKDLTDTSTRLEDEKLRRKAAGNVTVAKPTITKEEPEVVKVAAASSPKPAVKTVAKSTPSADQWLAKLNEKKFELTLDLLADELGVDKSILKDKISAKARKAVPFA
jgi:hypothetical protein